MSAIGILGGMGPQASAHLQALLVHDTPKHTIVTSDTDFPEIIMISVAVPNFVQNKKNIHEAKKILINRTKLLQQAGSTVNGIACNTAHLFLDDLQSATSVPFLSIPTLVAKTIAEQKLRRVGLLATPNTLTSTLYDTAIDSSVVIVRPDNIVARNLEKLIFRKLQGISTNEDSNTLKLIIQNFTVKKQLDAVILGCTELPLIYDKSDDINVIDTLQLLSDGLLSAFFSRKDTL